MKACIAKASIKELDALIMPANKIDPKKIDMTASILLRIRGFTLNLWLVHKYKQQSRSFGSRVVPWKTVFEKKTGKKLLVTEDQLFMLYNYVTTTFSQFGQLIRMINDRSSDKFKAARHYYTGHSFASSNESFKTVCWKYCHQFPKRLQTSCPGRGKCAAEKACTSKKCTAIKCF